MGVCQFGSEESQGTREVQDGKQLSHGNSFMEQVLKSEEWSFTEMTADNLVAYQHWLGENNVSLNTISAYMRALRALYHRVMGHEGNLQVVNPLPRFHRQDQD